MTANGPPRAGTSAPPAAPEPGGARRFGRAFRGSVVLIGFLVVWSGLVYPGVITLFAQEVTPGTANGSITTAANGSAVASSLLGENITNASLFWLRPSMIDLQPFTGAGSEAPLGPSDPALKNQTLGFIQQYGLANVSQPPLALVSDSASGLDPDLTLGGALVQIPRVAAHSGFTQEQLRTFVNDYTVQPALGIFGPAYVNVIQLDLILINARATNAPLPSG